MKKRNFLALSLSLLLTHAYATSSQNTQALINFLIANRNQVGLAYQAQAGELNGLSLPLSYYDTSNYWGEYVCQIAGNNCRVDDDYNDNDYTLKPNKNSPGAQLQIERVNVHNGTDIYDAACWQIALAVAGSRGIQNQKNTSLFKMADNQNKLLEAGYDGNASNYFGNWANRAYTQNNRFNYHGVNIDKDNAKKAYFYRMIPMNWLSDDPFIHTHYLKKYVTTSGNLPSNYQTGNVTWLDWKPITGENAWAFFIGPMQSSYLQYVVSQKKNYVPFSVTAIQNAMNVLSSFRLMQSPIGAIYYAVPGSLGNVGNQPTDPYEVSVENNASALAGLLMTSQVLTQELKNENDLTANQKKSIVQSINDIYTMIYGGQMPAGDAFNYTNGLLSFFKIDAWQDGEFIQGGLANKPNHNAWEPTFEPKAVDVNTWGLTVLGQPLIDKWFGENAAFNAWKKVKAWGGFTGPDGKLWGVGYSDKYDDENLPQPLCEPGNYDGKHAIISAEWTAGAVNLVHALSEQYAKTNNQQAVLALKTDEKTMRQGLLTLRSDNYANDNNSQNAYKNARPANYKQLIPIPQGKLSYIYASRRCFIPFGWMANPLPSTTSTSWAVMVNNNFNPFALGGAFTANPFYWGNLKNAMHVTVINAVKNAEKIGINFMVNGNWKYGPNDIAESKLVTVPANTSQIQVVYTKNGENWYPACTIQNPDKLSAYANIFGNKASNIFIKGFWTNNQGSGECQVVGNTR